MTLFQLFIKKICSIKFLSVVTICLVGAITTVTTLVVSNTTARKAVEDIAHRYVDSQSALLIQEVSCLFKQAFNFSTWWTEFLGSYTSLPTIAQLGDLVKMMESLDQDTLIQLYNGDFLALLSHPPPRTIYLGVGSARNGTLIPTQTWTYNSAKQFVKFDNFTWNTTYDGIIRPWYTSIRKVKGDAVWSRPSVSITTNSESVSFKLSLSMSIVNKDGIFYGVVMESIFLDVLSKKLNEMNLPPNSVAFLLDGDENMIACSRLDYPVFKKVYDKVELGSATGDYSFEQIPMKDYALPIVRSLTNKLMGVPLYSFTDYSRMELDGSYYYMGVNQIDGLGRGMDWVFILLIPESALTSELFKGNTISVIIAVLVISVSLVAAVLFGILITRPLSIMQIQMIEILHTLDAGDLDSLLPSKLLEISNLQSTFMDMAKTIKEYRSFLPSSVWSPIKNPITHLEKQSSHPPLELNSIMEELSQHSNEKPNYTTSKFDRHLTQKIISILCVYFPHFMTLSLQQEEKSSETIFEIVSPIIAQNQGYIYHFGSGWIIATWNAMSIVAGFEFKACKAALEIMSIAHSSSFCTITTSKMGVGIVGSTSARAFSVDYKSYLYLDMVRRLALDLNIKILLDHDTYLQSNIYFETQLCDITLFNNENKPTFMYQCLREKHTPDNGEWMYQISIDKEDNPYTKVKKLISNKDYQAAHQILKDISNINPNNQKAQRLSVLTQYMTNDQPYTSYVTLCNIIHPSS